MKHTLIGLAALLTLGSCTQVEGWFGDKSDADSTQTMNSESAHRAALVRDESITRENAYSDLFLDSTAINDYTQQAQLTADKAQRLRDFYLVCNSQYAWFTSQGLTEQARSLWSLVGTNIVQGQDRQLDSLKLHIDSLLTNDSTGMALRVDTSFAATELALTARLVDLPTQNNGVITADNFYWLVPRKKMDAMQLADSLLHRQNSSLVGNNVQYTSLKKALQVFYDAARDSSAWQPLAKMTGLRKGSQSPAVAQLKKRLAAMGSYPAGDTSATYTDSLTAAIRTAQEQFGQKPTGTLTDSLLAELNVPATQRVQQILVNMNRALWTDPVEDSAHIMVNVPSLNLVVYNDSGQVMQMPVIVGREGTGTMAFAGNVTTVVFSPYWNLPQSIVKNEIKPQMDKDPNYLKKRNMEIVRQNDSLPQIRQLPGKDNALGQVKYLFPNSFDIYLHDTPNKALFAQKDRALSHGCIRVANPDSLAAFILRGQNEWTSEKIRQAMNSGKEQQVKVAKPVPVAITYYTAFADPKGRLNFRKDVYGYDQRTAAQLFTQRGMI